jgi:regulator of CtrA degradation
VARPRRESHFAVIYRLRVLRFARGLLASGPASGGQMRHNETENFTDSAMFDRTFDEGMSLVEETARYLDGKGREEARGLPRKAAMLYAGESMRITTRLMQAASWLLVQRAVRDGDMARDEAMHERYRLGSREVCLSHSSEDVSPLPLELQELLVRSDRLYRRIARLDDILFGETGFAVTGARAQQDALAQAFGN